MPRTTAAARISALESAVAALVASNTALIADIRGMTKVAPAKAAPAAAKAESPFVIAMRARAAAKVACAIHPAADCNRRFSPASSGGTNHVAKIV